MIVGAGLAGLIAAHAWPKDPILEVSSGPLEQHKALLRFRGSAVGDLTGIEFQPVTVHKGIYSRGEFVQPNPLVSNWYAQKVVGKTVDRSIWDLSTSTRYIAPENLYERLIDAVGDRIEWGTEANFRDNKEPIINTAPLPVVMKGLDIHTPLEFKRQPIVVERFRVPNANIYQTIYFPDPGTTLYRASITGDLLICEHIRDPDDSAKLLPIVAFGLDGSELTKLGSVEQRYGKIAPVDNNTRKALLARLSTNYNIFSLGRFATWRNLLLDDVVQDVAVIKRLMTATSYDRKLIRG